MCKECECGCGCVDVARIEAAKELTLGLGRRTADLQLDIATLAGVIAEAFQIIYAAIEEVTTEKAGKE